VLLFSHRVNADDVFQTDFGFSGLDAGKNVVVVGGNNWNDATSPFSVRNAFNAAQVATFF